MCKPGGWLGRDEWNLVTKLYHVVSGRGWVEVKGNRYWLKAGRIQMIPSHATLSYGATTNLVIEWLHFRLQSAWLDARLGTLSRVHVFDKTVTSRWAPACRLISRYIKKPANNDAFPLHAMLLELTGLIFIQLPPEQAGDRLLHEKLQPAIDYMEANAARHPSLAEVARKVNISPEHFHRLFRTVFNTTPFQYMHARCMSRAQELLSEGEMTVAEVAEQCGYEDPFYFSRVFHQHFGTSPGKVRQGKVILGPKP